LADLLNAWYVCYPKGNEITTLKCVKQDIALRKNHDPLSSPNEWDDLELAVLEFDRNSAKARMIDTRTFGNTLKRIRGRIIEGKRFVEAGTYNRAAKWRVERVESL